MAFILPPSFERDGLMPHASHPELLWAQATSDGLIALACFSILLALMLFLRRRHDLQFGRFLSLFSFFILAVGVSQLVSLWTLWHPVPWLQIGARAVEALAALAAAASLWLILPRALGWPSNAQLREAVQRLEVEVRDRKQAEEALRRSQAMLRELADYRDRIREDERKRIAREIHDDLGQNLLALRLDVASLHARTARSHRRLHQKVGVVLDCIDTTIKSIRNIMNNLRPAVLDLGLKAAIEWQVHEFRRASGIECELAVDDQSGTRDAEGLLSDEQATAIFRVLQESLTNIRRHAQASHVDIALRITPASLQLDVTDNGVGMYPNDRRKAHRFGLLGMEERMAILGGHLQIDSSPGHGTRVQLGIPLQPAATEPLIDQRHGEGLRLRPAVNQ
ncbi:Signal transduction histidine kinase [Noviherbaspirillum humi]|uniref:Signal transduction histidine kinase n=1 Tax=Noviherbaspirillum humi TaxID=1688639 RepID=A0A239BS67_9BURK|nr:ATP-binding protein [Noviherbaspirillum humi]SNS10258.1 Signal transduction histidine kinase [Noviherbaspirillum humi]